MHLDGVPGVGVTWAGGVAVGGAAAEGPRDVAGGAEEPLGEPHGGRGPRAPHGDGLPWFPPAPTTLTVLVSLPDLLGPTLDPEVKKFVMLWNVFLIRALSSAHIFRIVCLT